MIGCVCAGLAGACFLLQGFEPLELRLLDLRFACNPYKPEPPPITVVVIDQPSLEQVYQTLNYRWPWPRVFYGRMIEYLASVGARAIVFDLFFSEPDIDRDIPGAASDAALVAATRQGGNVYHTYVLQRHDLPPPEAKVAALQLTAARQPVTVADTARLSRYPTAALPDADLIAASRGLGFANVFPDRDGIIRRMPLLAILKARPVPSMALAAYQALHDSPPLTLHANRLASGQQTFPSRPDGSAYLWWYKPGSDRDTPFPLVSAFEVLQARAAQDIGAPNHLDPALFKDRVVYIGATASGLFDLRATPLSGGTPGVFVQATALANLLDDALVTRTARLPILAITLVLCLLAGVAACGTRGIVVAIGATGAMLATIGAGGALLLFHRRLFVDLMPMLSGVSLTFVVGAVANYLRERRHSKLVRGIFEHYLDRKIVQTLIANPDQVKLGGERRECTVLFADVADFTSLSEQLAPEQVVHFMNVYLEAMTAEILEAGGFVDKFVGDEIIAIFGAPATLPDHATCACRAVLAMQRRLPTLQPTFRDMGCHGDIFFRAGLSTGPLVIGNMGSESRMNYTAMGDVMNLGARLESANKQYHTRIMVSAETARQADKPFRFRELDRVRVKGKAVGVSVYELRGECGVDAAEPADALAAFAEGFRHYTVGAWEPALAAFRHAAELGDAPADVFAQRCLALREHPPTEGWDGVFTLTRK